MELLHQFGSQRNGGLRKLEGPFLDVPITGTIVFGGLFRETTKSSFEVFGHRKWCKICAIHSGSLFEDSKSHRENCACSRRNRGHEFGASYVNLSVGPKPETPNPKP